MGDSRRPRRRGLLGGHVADRRAGEQVDRLLLDARVGDADRPRRRRSRRARPGQAGGPRRHVRRLARGRRPLERRRPAAHLHRLPDGGRRRGRPDLVGRGRGGGGDRGRGGRVARRGRGTRPRRDRRRGRPRRERARARSRSRPRRPAGGALRPGGCGRVRNRPVRDRSRQPRPADRLGDPAAAPVRGPLHLSPAAGRAPAPADESRAALRRRLRPRRGDRLRLLRDRRAPRDRRHRGACLAIRRARRDRGGDPSGASGSAASA